MIAGIEPRPKGHPRKDGRAPPPKRENRVGTPAHGKQAVAGFSAINRKEVRPCVKYQVIYMNRKRYPISVMCQFFEVSRSGFYGYVKRLGQPEFDADMAELIRQCQQESRKTYGYRRVWQWLKARNIQRNPKTILRIMRKYELLSEIRRRGKWRQMGQQLHKYENLLIRQFHADEPKRKSVTDISYIHNGEGVL